MLTKEKYIQLRKNNQVDIDDLFEFYQKDDSFEEKVDWNLFQQVLPHYLQRQGNMQRYFTIRDQEFGILYLSGKDFKKIV